MYVSVEEQNRSFPSGLDCLKMYVYPDVLQMLCFCHNKQYNKLFSFSGGIEVNLHVEWAGVVILLLQRFGTLVSSIRAAFVWLQACRTSSRVLPTEDLIRPVLFLILPWITGVENILIWTALFWLYSHLSHTAVLCKAFSLCSESQILEWRECKNGAEFLFLLTASC